MTTERLCRRNLLKVGGGAVVGTAFPPRPSAAVTVSSSPSAFGEVNVMDFGAAGDGRRDNTAAFQRALAAAEGIGGVVRFRLANFGLMEVF